MNRALKTGTNLRDAKKNMMTNIRQISQVPTTNSFCLYLKTSVLSFINKALKIERSIHWGRQPYPPPLPWASCSINCIYHLVNVLLARWLWNFEDNYRYHSAIIWNKERSCYVAGNFFPTACILIGYYEDTWHLTMKLFPSKIFERATLQNLWQQSEGNIALLRPANVDWQAQFNSEV